MRNIKLTLAYDGTAYHGWQAQPDLPTIQGTLERVIGRILDHPVALHGSGRTDAGVHASHQVANFTTERAMDTDALARGLNALLPPDVRVVQVEEVDLAFHARFSARSKTYEYHLWRGPIVSPFEYRLVTHFPWQLDEAVVDEASRAFVGSHDFTSFCAAATEAEDRIRVVYAAEWDRDGARWSFRIRGNGFLQYMVRTIVGTILDIGQGRIALDRLPQIFAARDRTQAGRTMPPCGLYLVDVEY